MSVASLPARLARVARIVYGSVMMTWPHSSRANPLTTPASDSASNSENPTTTGGTTSGDRNSASTAPRPLKLARSSAMAAAAPTAEEIAAASTANAALTRRPVRKVSCEKQFTNHRSDRDGGGSGPR